MHQFVINDWKLAIKGDAWGMRSKAKREFSRLLIFHNDSLLGASTLSPSSLMLFLSEVKSRNSVHFVSHCYHFG